MDEATINPFSADLAQARADWTAAQASLKTSRDAYQAGASVRLAEIQASMAKIGQKLSVEESAKGQADAEFRQAYEAAGFEKTPAVQKVLNQRNDAIAVSEALHATLARLREEYKPTFMQACEDAEQYKSAHGRAIAAYNLMYAFEALEKHGPPILEAMAVLAGLGWNGDLLAELQTKARSIDRAHTSHDAVVGPLDLGPLAGTRLPTPAERQVWRQTLSPAANAKPHYQGKQIDKSLEDSINHHLTATE